MSTFPSIKKLVIATVIVVLLTTTFSLFKMFNKPYNVVYAMIEAYEKLEGLSGTLEYSSEDVGSGRRYVDTIDFKFKKPNKFYTVHKTNNSSSYTKIYDGQDVMFTFSEQSDMVRVDFMDPEMQKEQLKFLLLDNFTEEIKKHKDAINPKKIGSEVIAGKQTEGYEITFNYNDNITIQRLWVDRKLNLPLKWELFYPGFTTEEGKVIPDHKIVTRFINIETNPQLNDSLFVYDKEPGKKYYLNNPPLPDSQNSYVPIINIADTRPQIIDDIKNAYTRTDGEVDSFTAVIQEYKRYDDIVLDLEKTEVKRKKPDKYSRIQHTYQGYLLQEIYNGTDYWNIANVGGHSEEQHYEKPFKQTDNQLALLITVDELERIEEITSDGSGKIIDRDAVLYKFRFAGSELFNKMWVDSETNLPLLVELNQGKLINVKGFTELNFNPQIDDAVFIYTVKNKSK